MRIQVAFMWLSVLACTSPPAPPPASASAYKPTSFTVKVTGSGRPVIFIPGLACDGSVWDGTVAHFRNTVQAHVVTLAGFGGSPPLPDKPLLPTARAELVEYIKQNHLDRPILVGHSLGGFLTFWVSETAPELVGAAVSVDGAPNLGSLLDPTATPEKIRANAEAFTGQMAAMPPDAFGLAIRQFLGHMMSKPEDVIRIGAIASKSEPKTTGDAMLFLFTTDLRPDLGKIQAPVLVIAADTNGQAPRQRAEADWHAQVDAIPKHQIVFIEHSKHFVMLDQPSAFYSALDQFIARK
jgi:N-formylmaleamate deformylase